MTNQIYVANYSGGSVTVIDEQQVQAIPLTTGITPLANNKTNSPTPSFTFNAQSTTATVPDGVYFKVDTWQGGWSAASGSDPTFTGTVATLQPGFHFLYAYAVDGQEATSTQPGSPLTGSIQAYGFLVTPSLGPPTVVSLSPSSGSGAAQTFTGVYSDPNGTADLATVRMLFNTSVSGPHSCYVFYYPSSNLLYLENDANTGLTAGVTPGSTGQVSNSQCTLSGSGSSRSISGNNLTLKAALTFNAAFAGEKNVYLWADEGNGSTSHWVQKGTWTVASGPPTVVSLSPSSGSGKTQTFTGVYNDPNGTADLSTLRMLFNTAVSGPHSCYVFYYPGSNLLYLENDTDTGLTAGIAPGSAGHVSNSQCTLAGTGSSSSGSGNNLTLKAALTFSSAFVGQKNVYLRADSSNGTNSGWVQKGTWTPATLGPPTVVSLSPSSGSGTAQTFTGVYADPNGTADLATVRMLFNTAVSGPHSCYVFYYPSSNLLYLENDGDTGLTAGVTPGSSGHVSNSQCTLAGAGSSSSVSGNNLTVKAALTFSGTFTGQKNVYLRADESNGTTSGWVQKGAWTP